MGESNRHTCDAQHVERHLLRITERLERIENGAISHWREFNEFREEVTKFMADMKTEMDNLRTQVTAIEEADKSIIAVCEKIAALLKAIPDASAQVRALADELQATAAATAAAALANTPAE